MEIIIASSNKGKIREINKFLEPLGIVGKSIEEYFGYDIDICETASTYYGNAKLKAETIYEIAKKPVLAEDSGFEVEAMEGQLGVYTARYMGYDTPIDEKIAKIYEETKGKTQKIKYVCCLILYKGPDEIIVSEAEVKGIISKEPIGTEGFAYDKIFYYEEAGKTFAQMSMEEKNKISHRVKALEKLIEEIKK